MSFGDVTFGEATYGEEAGAPAPDPNAVSVSTGVTLADTMELDIVFGFNAANTLTIGDVVLLGEAWYYNAVQSLSLSEAQQFASAYAAKARLQVTSTLTHQATAVAAVAEELSLDAQLLILLTELADEPLTVTAANAFTEAFAAAERLQLAGVATTRLAALQLVAQAIVLGDYIGDAQTVLAAETLELISTVLVKLIIVDLSADAMTLADTSTSVLLAFAQAVDDLEITTATEYWQYLVALIEERAEITLALRLEGGVYAAWVLNPATSGFSRYDNFPYNSMAHAYGAYYGVAEDGVYLMQGDDDEGAEIKASFKTGLTSLGERRSKRINDVFLGVLSSGELVLKVTADEAGARTEAWYRVERHGDAANHRAKVGKGLKGIYWGFELVNVNGADFDLDNLQLYPLTLSRRV